MIEATNNFIFITRDEAQSETSGFFIPDQGREKPHSGQVVSVGSLVQDKRLKQAQGKRVLFHKGVGFTIEFEEVEYLVLTSEQVIALV